MKDKLFKIILFILFITIIFLISAPVMKMLLSLSPDLIKYIGANKEILNSIFFTFKSSLLATVFGIIFGIPTAYILARYDFPFKNLVESLIDIPVMFPHSAAGIALLSIYGSQFFLGKVFKVIGIEFVDSIYGVILGMFFVSFTYLTNSTKEGFKRVDKHYEYVSLNLGASRFYTFRKVVLPLAFSDIFTGIIMMWARGLSEFGAVVILAYHPMTAPVMIYEKFTSFGLKYSKPIAVVMIYFSLIILFSNNIFLLLILE
jgi:molybdate/tungstate transport system permease protein